MSQPQGPDVSQPQGPHLSRLQNPDVGDAVAGFPGATAVSRLRVYDWPAADGRHGGSPHLHTASAEGYVVLRGAGMLETLSSQGYAEHALAPGTLLWFTPGTVHRLVNTDGELEILVVMQNAGLPEAGDAVLTFAPSVLADPEAYAQAADLVASAGLAPGVSTDSAEAQPRLVDAARRRRDLAIDGYLPLRDRVLAEGPSALADLHHAAANLVRRRATGWRALWKRRALAQALRTGDHLDQLAEGRGDHLAQAAVHTAALLAPPTYHGMCGHLGLWDLEGTPIGPASTR